MKEVKSFKTFARALVKKTGGVIALFFSKDASVFLLFLIIAFLLWWFKSMSRVYEVHMETAVELTGMPETVRTDGQAAFPKVKFTVTGKGGGLRRAQRRMKRPITVKFESLSAYRDYGTLVTRVLEDSIQKRLEEGMTLIRLEPDSLYFNFMRYESVSLPVTFDGEIAANSQRLVDTVFFIPDSVEFLVPLRRINELDGYKASLSKPVVVQTDTTFVSIPVTPPEGMMSKRAEVTAVIVAPDYTEKRLQIPITGVNLPPGQSLKTFPSHVGVTFWVRMSDFSSVSEADFKVVADYSLLENPAAAKIPLRVVSAPESVTKVRLASESVSYLLETLITIVTEVAVTDD